MRDGDNNGLRPGRRGQGDGRDGLARWPRAAPTHRGGVDKNGRRLRAVRQPRPRLQSHATLLGFTSVRLKRGRNHPALIRPAVVPARALIRLRFRWAVSFRAYDACALFS